MEETYQLIEGSPSLRDLDVENGFLWCPFGHSGRQNEPGILIRRVLAVRIGKLEQVIDGLTPVWAHVLLIENRPPVPSLCDFRSLFFGHKNGALSNRGKRLREV